MITDRQHRTGPGHGRRSAQEPEPRIGPGRVHSRVQVAVRQRLRQRRRLRPPVGMGDQQTTTWFWFGAHSYRDPRFGPRTAAASQGTEYTGRGSGARSG
jgi:hypothetical protein